MLVRKRREEVRRATRPAGDQRVPVCDSSPEILIMKTKNVRRSAFVILRALIASLLCFTAVMLALFASGALPQRSAGGGAVKLDKNPAERPRTKSKTTQAIPYSGPPRDLRSEER